MLCLPCVCQRDMSKGHAKRGKVCMVVRRYAMERACAALCESSYSLRLRTCTRHRWDVNVICTQYAAVREKRKGQHGVKSGRFSFGPDVHFIFSPGKFQAPYFMCALANPGALGSRDLYVSALRGLEPLHCVETTKKALAKSLTQPRPCQPARHATSTSLP